MRKSWPEHTIQGCENALYSFGKTVTIPNYWHLLAECVLKKSEHIWFGKAFLYPEQKKSWKIEKYLQGDPILYEGKMTLELIWMFPKATT